MSSEYKCVTCGFKYDYVTRIATSICSQNHMVCKICADELYQTKSKCPHCLNALINVNPYGVRQSYENNNNQPQNYNQNYNQNDPINRYQNNQGNKNNNFSYGRPIPEVPIQGQQIPQPPLPYQPHRGYQTGSLLKQPKKLLIFAVISLVIFCGAIGLRIAEETCEFWAYRTCYKQEIYSDMCCRLTDSCSTSWYNCDYVTFVQESGLVTFTTIIVVLSAVMFVFLMVNWCRARRLRRAFGVNYVRV